MKAEQNFAGRCVASAKAVRRLPRHLVAARPAADPCGEAWCEWDGLLVLDACGCVTFCSTAGAELLGRAAFRIVGRHVTSLIPEIPFGRHTPESNLAFVGIHGRDGVWTRRPLWTADGMRVRVEVSLGATEDVGRRSIVLIIKYAGSSHDIATRLVPARDTLQPLATGRWRCCPAQSGKRNA